MICVVQGHDTTINHGTHGSSREKLVENSDGNIGLRDLIVHSVVAWSVASMAALPRERHDLHKILVMLLLPIPVCIDTSLQLAGI